MRVIAGKRFSLQDGIDGHTRGGCVDWRCWSYSGRAGRADIAGFDDVVGSSRQRQSGENRLGRGCRELKRQIRNAGSGELIGRSRSRANLVGEIDSGRPPVLKFAVYSKAAMVTSVLRGRRETDGVPDGLIRPTDTVRAGSDFGDDSAGM
jgi:hypothetical protein